MRVRVIISDKNYQHSNDSYHIFIRACPPSEGEAVNISFLFPNHKGGVWEAASLGVGKAVARWLGQQLLAFADSNPDT